MGIFDRFKKSDKPEAVSRGFHAIQVKELIHLNKDAIQVSFEIPADLQQELKFIPGQ